MNEVVAAFDYTTGAARHVADKVNDVQPFGATVFCPSVAQEAIICRHHMITVTALLALRPQTCAMPSSSTLSSMVDIARQVISTEQDMVDPEIAGEEAKLKTSTH